MKVIRSSTRADWKARIACHCGAILEVSADDLAIAYTPETYDMDRDWYSATFKCPECDYTQSPLVDQSILAQLYRGRELRARLAEAYYSK